MSRKRYDPETKAAIIDATVTARSAGKSWAEAFEVAKEAGYSGTGPALEQMIRVASKKSEVKAEVEAEPAAQAAPRKRGRPKGSKNAAKAKRQVTSEDASGLSQVQNILAKEVRAQVNAALGEAIAQLQKLIR